MVIIKQDLTARAAGYVIISFLVILVFICIAFFIYIYTPNLLPILLIAFIAIFVCIIISFQTSFPRVCLTDEELIVQNYLQRRGNWIMGRLIYKFKLNEIERVIIGRGGRLKELVGEKKYEDLFRIGQIGWKSDAFPKDDQVIAMRRIIFDPDNLFICVLMKNNEVKVICINNFEYGVLKIQDELQKKGVEVLKNTIPFGGAYTLFGK